MENTENLRLIYIEPVGSNSLDLFEYEFLFAENPDIVWADDWAEQCPSACQNMRPGNDMVAVTKRLATIIPIGVIQNNSCFSMQDCMDGIVSLAWEDISDYEEYPEPIRLKFDYGEEYESVRDKLASRSQFFLTSKVGEDEF